MIWTKWMRWTMAWKKLRWNVISEVDNVTREELMSSNYVMICCKPITKHHSLSVNIQNKYNNFFCLFVCLFVCFCNAYVNLLSLPFQTQLKKLINIFQHCSTYLFGFFKTNADWVTLVPLGAIGFDGLIVVNEVTGFGELAVCGGATFSGNLVVVSMIL